MATFAGMVREVMRGEWVHSVRTKLVVAYTVLVAAIALFVFGYFPANTASTALRLLQNKGRSIAEMTAYSLCPALYFADAPGIEEALAVARQNHDLVYVVVTAGDSVVAAFNPEMAERNLFRQPGSRPRVQGEVVKEQAVARWGGEEIGRVYVGLSLEEVRRQVRTSRVKIAAISLLVLGVGFAAVLSSSIVLTEPLQAIARTARRIAAGDLSQRATVRGKGEIAVLASAFNKMMDDLASAYARLEEANAHLERRVEERTQQLRNEVAERERAQQRIAAALREKTVLFQEVHHRVKNNMQVISSMLRLQSGYLSDPQALEAFNECQNRVKTMALIHEKLYQSKNLAMIDFGEYVQSLASQVVRSYGQRAAQVQTKVEVKDVVLGVDAGIPCGLIINELLSNAVKHAFPEGKGTVSLRMNRSDGLIELRVVDDGIGFPKDVDFRNPGSLGLQLVNTLVNQLEGSMELVSNGKGSEFRITFPAPDC